MQPLHKTKILYVITKSNWGGAQKYVFDLATSLNKDLFEPTVLLGGNGELKNRLEEARIRVISLSDLGRDIHILKDISVLKKLISIFKKEKPEIIHINSSKIGGLGGLAGRIAHVPKILFTCHAWAFNEDRSFYQKIIIRKLHWITILLCHKTITVSETLKRQMEWMPFTRSKLQTLYTGVQKPIYYSHIGARDLIRETTPAIPSQSKDIWIGTVAELHKNKGHDTLIDTLVILKNNQSLSPLLRFVFIGEGEERKHLEERISKENLSSQVFLTGNIPYASRFLKAFDLFVLPSNTEALGYVLLEAGFAQLPVLATKVGGIPEIIEDMKTGILVHPKNPKELAKALTYLIDSKQKRTTLAKALHERVTQSFDQKDMISKTESVYLSNNW